MVKLQNTNRSYFSVSIVLTLALVLELHHLIIEYPILTLNINLSSLGRTFLPPDP
ncbi:unnamed protein product, partial [Rotaria magnacalcarata]